MLRAIALIGSAALLLPAVALAEPTDTDRATARALAREGYEAEKHAQYEIAVDRFTRADALVHAPTLLLGRARALAGLGKFVEAQETYERILREPLAPNAPRPFAKAVEDARRELADLTPRLAWVTLSVVGPSSADVTVDDVAVPRVAMGIRRACDPGAHSVKATAPGYAPVDRTFVVSEGGEQSVTLTMNPLPRPVVVAARPVEPAAEPEMPLTTKIAIASFGVGAAGIVTGAAAGIWVLARHPSLQQECSSGGAGYSVNNCNPQYSGAVRTYQAVGDLSTVAFIVGGVGAAAGLSLVFVKPSGSPVTGYVGPLGAGITAKF